MEKIVKAHDPSQPLFMYMAFQNVHAPNQAPENYIEKYTFIKDRTRRVHAAMADILDTAVGNITQAFREAGLAGDVGGDVIIYLTSYERRQTLALIKKQVKWIMPQQVI